MFREIIKQLVSLYDFIGVIKFIIRLEKPTIMNERKIIAYGIFPYPILSSQLTKRPV